MTYADSDLRAWLQGDAVDPPDSRFTAAVLHRLGRQRRARRRMVWTLLMTGIVGPLVALAPLLINAWPPPALDYWRPLAGASLFAGIIAGLFQRNTTSITS